MTGRSRALGCERQRGTAGYGGGGFNERARVNGPHPIPSTPLGRAGFNGAYVAPAGLVPLLVCLSRNVPFYSTQGEWGSVFAPPLVRIQNAYAHETGNSKMAPKRRIVLFSLTVNEEQASTTHLYTFKMLL